MKSLRFLGIFIFLAFLSACSTLSPTTTTPTSQPPAVDWAHREASLTRIQHWQVNGKIAVRSGADGGSATVNWIQQPGHYTISLLGPLGSHGMKLTGSANVVVLETSDGKRYTASSPEELLAKQGFNLPVSYLHYWVRGLPVPHLSASTQFDQQGRLTQVIQNGIRVQYLDYTSVGRIDLPQKMTLTSSNINMKMIIYQWSLT